MSENVAGSSFHSPIGEVVPARLDPDGVGVMDEHCRSDPDEVFVYGTLVHPDQLDMVLDDWSHGPETVLYGLHRVSGRYPTLLPGGQVCGRIVRTSEIGALDRYEGVDRGLYVRVCVPWQDRDDRAWVYIGDPERLGIPPENRWPGSGSFEHRIRAFVRGTERPIRIAEC